METCLSGSALLHRPHTYIRYVLLLLEHCPMRRLGWIHVFEYASSMEATQISNSACFRCSGFNKIKYYAFHLSYMIKNCDCKYHKLAELCELVWVPTCSVCVTAECLFNCVIFQQLCNTEGWTVPKSSALKFSWTELLWNKYLEYYSALEMHRSKVKSRHPRTLLMACLLPTLLMVLLY